MLLPTLIAIPLFLIWVLTVVDIVRRHDLSTSRKLLWALFVLVIPVVGVIVYFIVRPPQADDRAETLDAIGDEGLEPMRRGPGPA